MNAKDIDIVINKTDGESIRLSYQTLSRSNYIALAFKMIVFLLPHGIWRVVEPSDANSAVKKTDKVALAMIY